MSEKLARALFKESEQLTTALSAAGWLPSADNLIDTKSPVDLFSTEERPLVVGLFGGTGVGKSSLLNRLAGAEIARTGVVRPTSMEITAYLHDSATLNALPDHFNPASFSANRHSNDALADVMWVDMPDFDSDETANRDQVLQWLPHIDLLIYVVTPERYKDAEGWSMMLENSYRHAWLFVINKWDRADPVQYQDFVGLLEGSGFSSPQVFRTVSEGQHEEDQFDTMVGVIGSLSNHKVVKHLQERGWMQRLERSQVQLQQHVDVLASAGSDRMITSFEMHWQEFEQSAIAHLDGPFRQHSELFAEAKTDAVSSVLKSLAGKSSKTPVTNNVATGIAARSSADLLWDEWLTVRYQSTVQKFQLADGEHGVPKSVFSKFNFIGMDKDAAAPAVTNTAENTAESTSKLMSHHLNQAVASAIKNPGTAAQRLVARSAFVLKIVLPILALVWVTWRVVNGFISGAEDRSAYVGLDFLVNGLLLAGLGWLVPFVVEKVFVPSLPDSIYRALHSGLKNGLQQIEEQTRVGLLKISEEQKAHHSNCDELHQRIDKLLNTAAEAPNQMLSRVLMAAPGNKVQTGE